MSFESDLEKWKQIEIELAQKLVWRNIVRLEYAPEWIFKDWDIKVTYLENWIERYKTFEVKNDLKSRETWNVWFEYRCNNKASGIFSSKADYIVYRIDDKLYYQDRWELLCKLVNVEKFRTKWWDNNSSEMFVVNKAYLPVLFNEFK